MGRWLTDVSPLLPLLSSSQSCSFTVQSAPWAGPWRPSLTLRFSSPRGGADGGGEQQAAKKEEGDAAAAAAAASCQQLQRLVPRAIVPLFGGGTFDAGYNARHAAAPVSFPTPAWARRAELVAVITGHGSDDAGCAEFCPTSHHFSVNGHERMVANFSDAGTPWGCAGRVLDGVVPNEHGTWPYGRGGWCDGQQVDPWVADVDVTGDLAAPGSGRNNEVRYRGLHLGRDPAPTRNPGYIMMESSIVLYGDVGGCGGAQLAVQR